jgi:hypothetical protein
MANILRVSLMGGLPGGEVWSVNPCYHLLDTPDVSAPELLTIAAAVNALTWSTGITAMMNVNTTVTGVRLEARVQIGGGLEAQAEAPRAVPVPGTGATTHPIQTALVASLRTDFPGPSNRGRLYFPGTGASLVSGSSRYTTANMNSFILGVKALLNGINTSIQPTLGPNTLVVWSRTGGSVNAVTSLRAGDVPDVQRRRRDQLVEIYSPTSFPT